MDNDIIIFILVRTTYLKKMISESDICKDL